MKDFEEFLKKALENKNNHNSVVALPITPNDRVIIDELKKRGLIKQVQFIHNFAVNFDFEYAGLHYFDE